jgi:hypothetical protein
VIAERAGTRVERIVDMPASPSADDLLETVKISGAPHTVMQASLAEGPA